MNCKIVRDRKYCTEVSSGGSWYIGESWACYTLEDPLRDYPNKVAGATAIWPGTYKLVLDWSDKYHGWMLHVLAVPLFEGIRIHIGNWAKDTEGCILVGRTHERDAVHESTLAYWDLCRRLSPAFAANEPVTLEVVNPQ